MSEGTALADACLAVSLIEPERPIPGNSELARLTRALDWDSTSIGAPETWPKSLKMAIRIMLTSRQPIWIGWGRTEFFYNDPYKSIIGGKHPWALARPTREVWSEIWPQIGPMLDTALGGDEGTYVEVAAPDHGAQRLSGGDLLHLLLQPDPERRRDGRRNLLRQQ